MAERSPPPRGKLLVSAALSASTMWAGCSSDKTTAPEDTVLPANPKGSLYDQNVTGEPSATAEPTAVPTTSASAVPSASAIPVETSVPRPPPTTKPTTERIPPPANPKGSLYDGGGYPAAPSLPPVLDPPDDDESGRG